VHTDFYVYQHCRADNAVPFYVGKGRGARATNFCNRGKYWNNIRKGAGGVCVEYPVWDVDEELALLAEVELIDAYRRRGLRIANVTEGGTGTAGYQHTEETKRKIGEANRTTPKASGATHGMYGKKHRPESVAAMSASQRAREWGEKHPRYGKQHTAETKAQISLSRKGKCVGEANPFYGKKHSAEMREKIGAAGRGRKQSAETISKRKRTVELENSFASVQKPVVCVSTGQKYASLSEAASILQLHRQCIRMVCNGRLKKTGGYVFAWGEK